MASNGERTDMSLKKSKIQKLFKFQTAAQRVSQNSLKKTNQNVLPQSFYCVDICISLAAISTKKNLENTACFILYRNIDNSANFNHVM